MRADTYRGVAAQPGLGLGWTRVATSIAELVSPSTIERIWLFAPVRREDREWGTAVLACSTGGNRRRIFAASYLIAIRGRTRGQGKVTVDEVGESPVAVIHEVIAGVMERAGETEPPVEIAPELWFGGDEPLAADPRTNGAAPGSLDVPSAGERAPTMDDLNEAHVQ
jgi:hypothetical protein